MLAAKLTEISHATLLEACNRKEPESGTLDFKAILYGKDEKARTELLKDVCAFANADGGDIVFGVTDVNGRADSLRPIGGENADSAARRIRQTVESGIEPRLLGLQFHPVQVDSGYVLIMRVPKSFDGPHCFFEGSSRRFVIRSGTHTADLDYAQLRAAFDQSQSAIDRVRSLRTRRTREIEAGATWRPMKAGPLALVQVIPIASVDGRSRIDVASLFNGDYLQFRPEPKKWGGASRTLNLDGLVVHPGSTETTAITYVQVFRTGMVESLRFAGPLVSKDLIVPSRVVAEFARGAIRANLSALRKLEVSGPALIGLSLHNLGDHAFAVGGNSSYDVGRSDRQSIVVPEAWVDSVAGFNAVDEVARNVLDVLWQSFGFESCDGYDSTGRWNWEP